MVRKDDIKLIDAVVKAAGLTKEQRKLPHRAISGEQLSYREILEEAKAIQRDFPGKR